MKISVAMAVYNGEKYIIKQLESIRSQSKTIDELIACDDGSTDNTERLFKEFVHKYSLEDKWKYLTNLHNKGYINNFLDCAQKCTGDVIFFSDQDDIWLSDKIEKMISVFNEHEDAMAVCCSISCIDENDKNSDTYLTKSRIGDGSIEKIPFEKQVSSMRSSGLTLAIRREILKPTAAIIRKYSLQYDSPFGLIYSAKGQFYRIHQPLVLHRVHSSNAGSPAYTLSSRKLERHIAGREMQCKTLEMMLECFQDLLTDQQKKELGKEIKYRKEAIDCLKKKKALPLFIQLFRFGKMDNKGIDIANYVVTLRAKIKGR